jgi:hypothetical protein
LAAAITLDGLVTSFALPEKPVFNRHEESVRFPNHTHDSKCGIIAVALVSNSLFRRKSGEISY